jgi:hypothetical protein
MVRLKNENSEWAIIDSKGNSLRTFTKDYFDAISTAAYKIRNFQFLSISEGVFIVNFYVENSNGNSIGCLDRNGNIIIPPSFSKIDSFVNGKSYAVKFLNRENISFEIDYWSGHFNGNFIYSEVGYIDKSGRWVGTSKSKMEYNYGFSANYSLTVVSNDPAQREREEREAANFQPTRKKMYNEAMSRLEAEVKQKVDAAKSRGLLVEKQK